jgi:hypothetical protein
VIFTKQRKEHMKQSHVVFRAVATVMSVLAVLTCAAAAPAMELPGGYMPLVQSEPILKKTIVITLAPPLYQLTPAERGAAHKLVEVGEIFQKLYETSRHHQARTAYESIVRIDQGLGSPPDTQYLLNLFYLFKGPIAQTLNNEFVPIAPVDRQVPGKNVYPWGITRREVDAFMEQHPGERESILGLRTLVRRAETDALRGDLATLEQYPVLAKYHPGLKERLDGLIAEKDEDRLYAIPYSVAYANDLMRASTLLEEAAAIPAPAIPGSPEG